MDADTTRTKGSYEKILSSFANEEADILIGTQMIVKGHDFPNVTLVGILLADQSLNASDYRSAERTFQLLTQAAGRAGRGKYPGDVVIQTYEPEHYSIVHAAHQNYEEFYREEMVYRKLLRYPPAEHLLAIQIISRSEEHASLFAHKTRALLEQLTAAAREKNPDRILFIGPAPAVLEKLRAYSGGNQYVFPSYRSETIPFGRTALQRAIRRMGFEKDEMCPHGFRAMASTLLNELGYNRDWIERQLAHAPTEQIRGIYNRAEYLSERRRMLQNWADYLDGLRAKARQEVDLE